jgi:hypothetical protein
MTMKVIRGFPWLCLVLVAPAFAGAQVTVSDEVTDAQRQAGPRQTVTLTSGRGVLLRQPVALARGLGAQPPDHQPPLDLPG